jgi:hypothetical protein
VGPGSLVYTLQRYRVGGGAARHSQAEQQDREWSQKHHGTSISNSSLDQRSQLLLLMCV